ncbi:ankyrin repeat domain-containing protein 54-like [Acanthaster planci]|uniref:Ankyrin repeat domain-containing protein 54-like n=1 Tax=Acanthaster planci TaxID=133434 RepID=A0A8B7Z9N4_ACAPL|nr:ankyrin repeat domain-containing protein 54-like [Acanthaster planci]
MNDARVASPVSESGDMFPQPPCGIVGSSPGKSNLSPGSAVDTDSKMNLNPRIDLNFGIRNWSSELAAASVNFSYFNPFGDPENLSSETELHDFVGKIRRPRSRLHCRRGAVVLTQNPLGKDLKGERKLRHAASKGDVEEVRKLLEEGVNPNRPDDKGRAPLHFAVTKRCHEMVQVLIDKGADVNQKDGLGNTPLHLAVFSSHMGVATTLLESGANTHELDREGHTPIHLARSRLRHIKDVSYDISCSQLQDEVLQLVAMLKVYMSSMGLSEHMRRLDQLTLQVQEAATNEQVDAIEDILNSFTTLSLQKP